MPNEPIAVWTLEKYRDMPATVTLLENSNKAKIPDRMGKVFD